MKTLGTKVNDKTYQKFQELSEKQQITVSENLRNLIENLPSDVPSPCTKSAVSRDELDRKEKEIVQLKMDIANTEGICEKLITLLGLADQREERLRKRLYGTSKINLFYNNSMDKT